MYFLKKVYAEAGEFSRIFVLKVTSTVCKFTFNCKLQKKLLGSTMY